MSITTWLLEEDEGKERNSWSRQHNSGQRIRVTAQPSDLVLVETEPLLILSLVRHSEWANGEHRGPTAPCEDKVELFPGPVGQRRGGECEVKCREEVGEYR